MPLLVLTGTARLWEPRRLRLRLCSTAAQFVTTGRRRYLHLAEHRPWLDVTDVLDRLHGPRTPADKTFPPLRATRAQRSVEPGAHPT